jgi:DNA replicative helicase MCM subunit Mcm2 (Cdc46/Mcm family)
MKAFFYCFDLDYFVNRYAEMRARQDKCTLPVAAQSLETLICLAIAHAKDRLRKTVEAAPDCVMAMDILSFALYHNNNFHSTPGTRRTWQQMREWKKTCNDKFGVAQ